MPLTPTERRSLKAALAPIANTLRYYHVVTFRDSGCLAHKAGTVLDFAPTCGCTFESTHLSDEAIRIADAAITNAQEFAFLARLKEGVDGVRTEIDAHIKDETVVDFGTTDDGYVPVETATGWLVGVEVDDPVMRRATFTVKVERTKGQDFDTNPEVGLRRELNGTGTEYDTAIVEAISQMKRLPGGSYVTIVCKNHPDCLNLDEDETPEHEGSAFFCKYCHTEVTSDQFVSTWDVSQELFLTAIMQHYYECKKIATFKRVQQYKITAQAWAFSTYGLGEPMNTDLVFSHIASDLDGNVTAVRVTY